MIELVWARLVRLSSFGRIFCRLDRRCGCKLRTLSTVMLHVAVLSLQFAMLNYIVLPSFEYICCCYSLICPAKRVLVAMDEADGLDAKELSFFAVIKKTPTSNFPWPNESFKIISWSKTNWL
jgi:hypothetical protein